MPAFPRLHQYVVPANSGIEQRKGFVVQKHQAPVESGSDCGYGEVTWRTLISADRTNSSDFLLGVAEFPPHGTLQLHRHTAPEFYYCVSGSGVVTIDGVAHQVSAGSAVFIPGNAEHGVKAGADGLSFAYGFARESFCDIEYVFSEQSNVIPFTAAEDLGFSTAPAMPDSASLMMGDVS